MTLDPAQLPDDVKTLKAMLIAANKRASEHNAEAENLKLTIAKLQRDKFGASSERGAKLLDQLELQLAELEEAIAQDQVIAAIGEPQHTDEIQKQKPARRPLPSHLPRERVVHDGPQSRPNCRGGSVSLAKTSQRHWSTCPRRGKSPNTCARSSRAAIARTGSVQ